MNGFKEWLTNFFAIKEERVSTLVIVLLALIIYIMVVKPTTDIPENFKAVITTLIYILGGVNITSEVTTALNFKKYKEEE